MKKIIFPLLSVLFLISGIQLIAQTPWYIGGNAIGGAATFGSTTAQPVVFISSGTERGRLQASGNWSFGTSASADRVQINSSGTANPLRVMFGGATKLLVHTGGGLTVGTGSAPSANGLLVAGGAAIGAVVTPPANGLFVATRIGIATASPAFTFDARGSSVFGQFKASGGLAGVIIDKSASNQNGYLIHRTGGSDRWTEGTIGNDNFNIHNWTTFNDALAISLSNNNVGIPTIDAGSKLNVVGDTTGGYGISVTGYYRGLSASTTYNFGYGILGSSNYLGVYGFAPSGNWGTYGYSGFIGAYGNGNTYGVYGSGGTYGVYGSGSTYGVYGSGGTYGVYASTSVVGGDGVHSNVSGNATYGVYSYSANSIGIYSATGNASSYAGYFAGNVYTTGSYLPSDAKLKKNIAVMDNAMDIINRLQPKHYEYRQDASFAKMNLPTGQHYGFIVQEFEQILPNLVKESSFDVGKAVQMGEAPSVAPIGPPTDGKPAAFVRPVQPTVQKTEEKIDFKAINYTELIPILVKGMQEQNAEITNLKNEITELKALIKNGNPSTATAMAGYLKQNSPNPPNGSTMIKYFVPNDSRNAQILVTDIKGSTLKTYKVTNGEGQITIKTGELPAGTYNYTLYVNNMQTDTKQMIIAR